jgi:hypothetical protein
LDALWDTASIVTDQRIELNPAEAFVFGGSVLLHDAGMTLAAYPNGIDDLKTTLIWKDISSTLQKNEGESEAVDDRKLAALVLRRLHAKKAAELAEQPWYLPNGDPIFLLETTELRRFYGPSIGAIAHSHWWELGKVERELAVPLGPLPPWTRNAVQRLKLACLLRVPMSCISIVVVRRILIVPWIDQRESRKTTGPSRRSSLHLTSTTKRLSLRQANRFP